MSKNFEKEYLEHLNAQAPDLWSRIEAGIGEQKVVPISASKKKKKKGNVMQKYRLLVSAAACLLALCLIVPVYRLVNTDVKKDTGSGEEILLSEANIENTIESTVATEENSEMAASEMSEAVMPEETEEAVDETVIAEMEVPEDMAEEPAEETASTEGLLQMEETGLFMSEGTKSEVAGNTDSIPAEGETTLAQETVTVTILAEEGRQEAGMQYSAVVAGVASENRAIVVPDDSGIVLSVGGIYTVTLEKYVEEGYYVVIAATAQ